MKKLSNNGILVIVLLVAALLLLTPHLVRFLSYDSVLLGEESYYHIRMAEYLRGFEVPDDDPLVDRPYVVNPYHFVLAASSFIIPLDMASRVVPFVLGLLSTLLLFSIFNSLNVGRRKILIILLMFVSSPIFVYIFATSSQYSVIIFLNLLGFYLYMRKSTLFLWLSIFVFYLIPFFNIFNALLTLVLLFVYTIYSKMGIKRFYFISVGIVLRTIIYHFSVFYRYGLPQIAPFNFSNILPSSISDLGGLVSFSFFTLLLAGVGLFVTWKKKREFYFIYPFVLILFVISFFLGDYANVYQNFIICILAGYGFYNLLVRKWSLSVMKNLTLLVIVCGIIFSTTSYISRLSYSPPDSEVVDSLVWLKDNSVDGSVVLSHPGNGFWIEALAGRRVVLDGSFDYIVSLDEKVGDIGQIFSSRNLELTMGLLGKYNISYIWIDKKMGEGLVWSTDDEGLLFLLQNSENFKKIKSYDGVDIWEFTKRGGE